METFKDYYRTLRVHPTADDVTIKAAFRRLALKYHPDVARNQRAARWFPNVQEAYAVLADPEKRREYDRVYRDRKPVRPTLSTSRKRRKRDGQAAGRFGRFGIALDVLGLRVGLAVDAGSVRPKVRRKRFSRWLASTPTSSSRTLLTLCSFPTSRARSSRRTTPFTRSWGSARTKSSSSRCPASSASKRPGSSWPRFVRWGP